MPENFGLPIDAAQLPEWAKAYFSPAQLRLDRGLLWSLLVYESRTLTDSATAVAQRLFVHAIGKEVKQVWPTQQRIAHDVKLSENTVITALDLLVEQGWLLKEPKPGDRRRWVYTLAWPAVDRVAAGTPKTDRCGHPTGKGGTCTRPAGWGTKHRGVGMCKLHELESPQPSGEPGEAQPAPSPQQLRSSTSGSPQSMEPITSTVEDDSPQPLEQKTSMIEDKYVRECVTEFVSGSGQGSLPPAAEVEVHPHPSQTLGRSASNRQPDKLKAARSQRDAVRLTDDARGRRWLTATLFLDDDAADEVIRIVRSIDPNIRNLARYLEAMHRDEQGNPKPDLLDIVEAVQVAGQPPANADEHEADPENFPEPGGFTRPPICTEHRGGPEDPRPTGDSRCLLCNDRRRKAAQTPAADARSGLRARLDQIKQKQREVRPSGKPVVRIAYSPPPELDAHREVVLRRKGHLDLPRVEEQLERRKPAGA
ncbi:helix-turn-helix domain-containing protein [Actinocorallia sp. B10E7]|uniref:helix-turn-helix domain-containing protein n=1 Tax=Actinocorallia sp. B10E7 TaxID=3153558 RepID=UPI00325E5B2B